MSTQVFDEDEIERYAQECVFYILSQHTKNTPIKRIDIIKTVIPDQGRRNGKLVLDKAIEILKSVYGLILYELEDNVKQYLVINNIEPNFDIALNWDAKTTRQQALLLPILCVIFMNGNSISEGELWAFLRKLRVIENTSSHNDYFGDVENIIKKELINQRYLVYDLDANSKNRENEERTYEFRWGKRAELEVSKELILKQVCEILKCEMTQWAEQYAQVTGRSELLYQNLESIDGFQRRVFLVIWKKSDVSAVCLLIEQATDPCF